MHFILFYHSKYLARTTCIPGIIQDRKRERLLIHSFLAIASHLFIISCFGHWDIKNKGRRCQYFSARKSILSHWTSKFYHHIHCRSWIQNDWADHTPEAVSFTGSTHYATKHVFCHKPLTYLFFLFFFSSHTNSFKH